MERQNISVTPVIAVGQPNKELQPILSGFLDTLVLVAPASHHCYGLTCLVDSDNAYKCLTRERPSLLET